MATVSVLGAMCIEVDAWNIVLLEIEGGASVLDTPASTGKGMHSKILPHRAAILKARKLQKRLGLRFRGTDNLSDHLIRDGNDLYIFHHVSFLKARLESFGSGPRPLSYDMETCLSRGKLPPQLLVETLHSIQDIIFPSTDDRSAALLDDLIRKEVFDEGCRQYEGYGVFHEIPETFAYQYWDERLSALHDEVTKAVTNRPGNKLESWFERHCSERNALIVALIALFITILNGFVSIGLAAFQSWVAYMAWKYPAEVSSSSG